MNNSSQGYRMMVSTAEHKCPRVSCIAYALLNASWYVGSHHNNTHSKVALLASDGCHSKIQQGMCVTCHLDRMDGIPTANEIPLTFWTQVFASRQMARSTESKWASIWRLVETVYLRVTYKRLHWTKGEQAYFRELLKSKTATSWQEVAYISQS